MVMSLSANDLQMPHLHSLNTLTIRKNNATQPHYKISTLEQLVCYINSTNEVPFRVHIEINNQLYTVYRGVQVTPQDTTIFIASRGYAKSNIPGTNDNFIQRGACLTEAYRHIYFNIINNAPVVSFDYDDSRTGFSLGQSKEINTLAVVYNTTLAKNPDANIVLIGDCRGAKVALELAIQKPKNLKALILLAPFISARELTAMIARNYLPSQIPFSQTILHYFFKFYFTHYNEKKDTLYQRLKYIPSKLPIFIAHRNNDTLVGMHTISRLHTTLKMDSGNSLVQLLIVNDHSFDHSRLTGNQEVQNGINSFLKKWGLPHHEIVDKNAPIAAFANL